jgi:hypothetical protein
MSSIESVFTRTIGSIPLTEDEAKKTLLSLDLAVRSAAAKRLPSQHETRKWTDLTWNERLALCEAFMLNDANVEEAYQEYNAKMKSAVQITTDEGISRRDEIRAEGSMLAYSSVYKTLVSEIVPNYCELTNVEKLVFLQNSDTPELRDREKAMIDHIKQEKIREEMSQVDTEAIAALALVRAGKNFDFYHKQSFPNLQKYCAIRPVEKYIKI